MGFNSGGSCESIVKQLSPLQITASRRSPLPLKNPGARALICCLSLRFIDGNVRYLFDLPSPGIARLSYLGSP